MKRHGRTLALFLLVFASHASFSGKLGWNQSARLAGAVTFVEPGPDRFTLRIDRFIGAGRRGLRTEDWSRGADGHYYADKAPGITLLAVPAYAALYGAESAAGWDPAAAAIGSWNLRLLNAWCTVVWTAAAAAVFQAFLLAGGAGTGDALLLALCYAFATLVFPYGASPWGHATSAAALLMAACLACWPGEASPRRAGAAGLLAGLAVLVEYSALFGAAAVAAGLVSRRPSRAALGAFGAGAALFAAALLACQKAMFGGFLTPAYARGNAVFLTQGLAWGVLGRVRPHVAWRLLFSDYRGLFPCCPVLLFAAYGALLAWRRGRRVLVGLSLGAFMATLLFVSGFNGWWGGWCMGPRQLIVALPWLVLLLPEPGELGTAARCAYYAALSLSAANMLVMAGVDVMVDDSVADPLYGYAWPLFLGGAAGPGAWIRLALAGTGAALLWRSAWRADSGAVSKVTAP